MPALKGPEPKFEINMAAPSMEKLFMNIICCIVFAIGSVIAKKLCIITVTGTRKSTKESHGGQVMKNKFIIKKAPWDHHRLAPGEELPRGL